MKRFVSFTLVAMLATSAAWADFSGPYDHSLWTFNDYGGDGAITANTATIVLVGDDAPGQIITTYTIEAPGDGTFSFDWSYECTDDPGWDACGYIVGDLTYFLSEISEESGSVSVSVLEGETIGFFVDTSWGSNDPGVMSVTNFNGPAPSGAGRGACCFLQTGCVGDMFESECLRFNGTYMGDGTLCDDVDCGSNTQSATAELFGPNFDMTTLPGCRATRPAVTFNSQDDEFAFVWSEGSLGHPVDIGAQRVTSFGGLAGDYQLVSMVNAYQVEPSVAYNSVNNEYLAAWRSQNGWPLFNSTVGQRFTGDLTKIDTPFQITGTGVGFEGAATYSPVANEYFITSRSYTPDPAGIIGARVSGGTVLDDRVELDLTVGITELNPAPNGDVTYNSLDDQYLATYSVQAVPTWSSYILRGRIANADGSMAGEPFAINFPPNYRAFYQACVAAFDPNAGRYLVVYGDAYPRPLHGQFVARDGTLIGYPFEISAAMTSTEVAPKMAFDPVNNVYLVVWSESPVNSPTSVFAQLLAADGTPLGGPLTVTTTAEHRPAVSADTNNGGFLVIWPDVRNDPDMDIYGQFIGVDAGCNGDLDGDSDIDFDDLNVLLASYGTTSGATYEMGDLDGDEDVDFDDLNVLLSVYGTSCP